MVVPYALTAQQRAVSPAYWITPLSYLLARFKCFCVRYRAGGYTV